MSATAMQLTFLAATDGTRMAKSFVRSSGTVVNTPYPHVRRFWSFTRNAADLDQLYALLVTHAEAGHCLLKGPLDRPLRHESRSGRTDPNAPTDLLVLDLDTDHGFESIDHFLAENNTRLTRTGILCTGRKAVLRSIAVVC